MTSICIQCGNFIGATVKGNVKCLMKNYGKLKTKCCSFMNKSKLTQKEIHDY